MYCRELRSFTECDSVYKYVSMYILLCLDNVLGDDQTYANVHILKEVQQSLPDEQKLSLRQCRIVLQIKQTLLCYLESRFYVGLPKRQITPKFGFHFSIFSINNGYWVPEKIFFLLQYSDQIRYVARYITRTEIACLNWTLHTLYLYNIS